MRLIPTPKSKFTPTQARNALLYGLIKARSGTNKSPVNNTDLNEVMTLLHQMEDEAEDLAAANLAIRAERDTYAKRLLNYGPKDWVPVADLSGMEHNEWLNVLLPTGKVEAAIYTEVFVDEIDGYIWCQWDEYGYEPMQVQPTHFYPQPAAPNA